MASITQDMRRRNPDTGLVVFWVKLMQRGYKRSIPVSAFTLTNRRFVETFEEYNPYSSMLFLEHLVRACPFQMICI